MSFQAVGVVLDATWLPRRLVLPAIVLAYHADPDGESIRPSIETIARLARIDRRDAQRYVRELVDLGVLELVRAGGAGARCTSEYRLNVARLAGVSDDEGGSSPALKSGSSPAHIHRKGGAKSGAKGGAKGGPSPARSGSGKEIRKREDAHASARGNGAGAPPPREYVNGSGGKPRLGAMTLAELDRLAMLEEPTKPPPMRPGP